jgi:hypothetical protein
MELVLRSRFRKVHTASIRHKSQKKAIEMAVADTSTQAVMGWSGVFLTLSAAVLFSIAAAVICLVQTDKELAFGERDTLPLVSAAAQ